MTEEEETYRSFVDCSLFLDAIKTQTLAFDVTKQDLLAIMFYCFVDAVNVCDGCATMPFDAMPRAKTYKNR